MPKVTEVLLRVEINPKDPAADLSTKGQLDTCPLLFLCSGNSLHKHTEMDSMEQSMVEAVHWGSKEQFDLHALHHAHLAIITGVTPGQNTEDSQHKQSGS